MTNPPLSEKEVEEMILAEGREDMERENNNIELTEADVKRAAKQICSHFSKPVIKLPEKKEVPMKESCETCEHKSDSGMEYCGSCESGVASNWTPNSDIINANSYNQALQDVRKLNGEGGV